MCRKLQINQILLTNHRSGQAATFHVIDHFILLLSYIPVLITCPSGIQHHHLLEIGQTLIVKDIELPWQKKYYAN